MEELQRMDGEISAYGIAAQKHANGFWSMAFISAVVWYFWGVGAAAIPLALAVFGAVMSGYCTMKAERVRRVRAFWKARMEGVQ